MKRTFFLFSLVIAITVYSLSQVQEGVYTDSKHYFAVDKMPEPVGGNAAIAANIVYPESARRDSMEGIVFVEAFLNEEGTVERTTVVRGIRNDLDVAAQNAVRATKFTPGMSSGKPVKVRIAIPIRFKLSANPLPPLGRGTVLIVQGPQGLEKTISYPEIAIRAGIQGEVIAQMTLDERKQMTGVKITQGVGAGLDQAVLRALATYDFPRDYQYGSLKGGQTITVVVRFFLTKEK